MAYFTERHGMRQPITQTSEISLDKYSLLLSCCEQYYTHIAWKYPEECPDGRGCCGLNAYKLAEDMRYEIPTLFKNDSGQIERPREYHNVFSSEVIVDSYDQYALLDFIEFIGFNCKDIRSKSHHSYYGHDDLQFSENNTSAERFREDINAIFRKTGLLYVYNEDGLIERVIPNSVVTEEVVASVAAVSEPGLKELLETAIALHKSPHPVDHKNAVEKLWDAFERLKTYYTTLNKKQSAEKIVNDMASGKTNYVNLFDAEFKALTTIGNTYRIRHHDTDKIDITDDKHYDYFFNRCLSVIALAIQYLN